MTPRFAHRAVAATLLALAASPSAASAAAAEPAPAAPAPASMTLSLEGVGGHPLFAPAGARITVRGSVSPYLAGQAVQLTLTLQGHRFAVESVPVAPAAAGKGTFHATFRSRYAGLLRIRAAHAPTPQQGAFTATAAPVRLVNTDVALGASGFSVGVLQSELAGLHYAVPLSGSFEEGTANALIAYRKMTGQQLVGTAGRKVFELLARRAGSFHVRYRGDGRHVEANLTKQVLALIEPGGRVHAIYTTSSGKPSTPTVLGRFRVYLKTPGVNSEGMVDSNYFIRGYAIHGYPEVPTYAASHGCLRVPIPDAPAIYAWVREGTPVDVYYQ